MEKYGIVDELMWFCDYLTGRTQAVQLMALCLHLIMF